MKLLKRLFKKKLIVNHLVLAIAVVALIGFTDATFLTLKHYSGDQLACGVNGGCNTVTTSEYATIFDIPVALLGAGYYLAMILMSIAYLDIKDKRILEVLKWLPISGLLASAWFVHVQLNILHEICIYCMGSATTSTLLFILGMVLLKKDKHTLLNLNELVK